MTLTHKMGALVGMAATCLFLVVAHTSSLATSGHAPSVSAVDDDDMASASSGFCKGMFMVMSMSGFQWSLLAAGGRDEPGDCLSYFAPGWKLDGRGKFEGAMVYTFLLAIMAEASYAFQLMIRPYVPKRLQHLTNSILYGIQRFMAYIIMLVAMMYSWELLISVILGLVVGRLLFPNVTRREWRREARRAGRSTVPSHPTLAATLDESVHAGEEEPLLAGDTSMRRRR
jgi:hypothetical protein